MDLQESKQNANENVSQYALWVETCLSQLLTEVSLSTTKKVEIPGRTAAMKDLAMRIAFTQRQCISKFGIAIITYGVILKGFTAQNDKYRAIHSRVG